MEYNTAKRRILQQYKYSLPQLSEGSGCLAPINLFLEVLVVNRQDVCPTAPTSAVHTK